MNFVIRKVYLTKAVKVREREKNDLAFPMRTVLQGKQTADKETFFYKRVPANKYRKNDNIRKITFCNP